MTLRFEPFVSPFRIIFNASDLSKEDYAFVAYDWCRHREHLYIVDHGDRQVKFFILPMSWITRDQMSTTFCNVLIKAYNDWVDEDDFFNARAKKQAFVSQLPKAWNQSHLDHGSYLTAMQLLLKIQHTVQKQVEYKEYLIAHHDSIAIRFSENF